MVFLAQPKPRLLQMVFSHLELNSHSPLRFTEWVVKPFNAPDVVLSVGRYLDRALAVQYLNPELLPPIRSPGFFLPAIPYSALSIASSPLFGSSIQRASTV